MMDVAHSSVGAAMSDDNDAFEMRRLEMLSNTIFGVAMTLLASDFPRDQFGSLVPDWHIIWRSYAPHLLALVFSFIVSGLFWLSHMRRLSHAPHGSRLYVLMNLSFLLTIVALPVTSRLYGNYSEASEAVSIYGFHLAIISAMNLLLWKMAASATKDRYRLINPLLATVVFSVAAVAALVNPTLPKFIWPIAFLASFLRPTKS
jgi:uncharacterized membrane protein